MLKYAQFLITWLILMASSQSFSQTGFPDDLYAMPLADALPGHSWSYRQGLDFDVIHFEDIKGNGVRIYMDVAKEVSTESYISATVMGQNVKLFKKCATKNDCMYTTTINAGVQQNGNSLWTQIWIKPEGDNLNPYLNWLGTLKFVSKS